MLEQMFDKLLSHLNAEENDMALELLEHIKKADSRLEKLNALENAGVDNWSGYDFAMEELEPED